MIGTHDAASGSMDATRITTNPTTRAARNQLVVDNLPLVGYLVAEVCARATHLSRDDLASAGALALVQAADAYDAALGVPFGAYARRRIMGAFADDMRSADWASRGTRKRIKATLEVQETLAKRFGRTPTIDEIASALGVDRAGAQEAMADAGRTVGVIDEIVEAGLAADQDTPEEQAAEAERDRTLRSAVAALPEKMRSIVEQLYFGGRTVGEIAEQLGVTHSAVSQQRTAALKLIRESIGDLLAESPVPVAETATAAVQARRAAYRSQVADLMMTDAASARRAAAAIAS